MDEKTRNKNARRTANGIALLLLFTDALSIVAYMFEQPLADGIAAAIGYVGCLFVGAPAVMNDTEILALTSSTAVYSFVAMLISFATTLLPFVLLSKCFVASPFSLDAAKKKQPLGFLTALSLFAFMQLVGGVAASLAADIGYVLFPDLTGLEVLEDLSVMTFADGAVYFMMLCVFTPLVEEFVFRGVIFGALRKHGAFFAYFASALFFGLAHGTPENAVFAALIGLFFAYVYERTGSLVMPMIFHGLNNAVSFFALLLTNMYGSDFSDSIYFAYYALMGVIAVLGVVRVFSKDAKQVGTDAGECAAVSPLCFVTPCTVVYIAVFLFYVLSGALS